MKFEADILSPIPDKFEATNREEAWKFLQSWFDNYIALRETKEEDTKK